MPIRTNRGRAAVYRRVWGWPLRSPRHLAATLSVVAVLAAGLGYVVGGGREPRPERPGLAAESTAGTTTRTTAPRTTDSAPPDRYPGGEAYPPLPSSAPPLPPAEPPAPVEAPKPGPDRPEFEPPAVGGDESPDEPPKDSGADSGALAEEPAGESSPPADPAPRDLTPKQPAAIAAPPPAPPRPPPPPPSAPPPAAPDASAVFAAEERENAAKAQERAPVATGPEVSGVLARLGEWEQNGFGMVEPVHFSARTGALLSGRVWATRKGPPKRPLVVVTSGGGNATETEYWWAAQTLAKAGYVVVTWDPQGQGASQALGVGPYRLAGVPGRLTGVSYFDGTQDAIDFGLSAPDRPYCPRPSRSGASHCGVQQTEAAGGTAKPFNPMWELVDPAAKVGLAGHSYGAFGVSWVGQLDERVGAVVAWDSLCDPTLPPASLLDRAVLEAGLRTQAVPAACLVGGQPPAPAPRVPSLGIAGDYLFKPVPFAQPPDRMLKARASQAFSAAGVDTGQIVIRGGTHSEFSGNPHALATLRGLDLAAWYTTAWFDRYVKGVPTAPSRLLTTRWQHDRIGAGVDPNRDGNLFSENYASRLDITLPDGRRWTCEDLRAGCPGMRADDGRPPDYSYLRVATRADVSGPPG